MDFMDSIQRKANELTAGKVHHIELQERRIMAHTPWVVKHPNQQWADTSVCDSLHAVIATVHNIDGNQEANAKLISLAPAMLEALKMIAHRMFIAEQEEAGSYLGKALYPDIQAIIKQIEEEA